MVNSVHRGAFCQFPFRLIYYCHSSKSTGKETGKTHLCAVASSILTAIDALQQQSKLLLVKPNKFKNILSIKKLFLIAKILSVEFMERVIQVKVFFYLLIAIKIQPESLLPSIYLPSSLTTSLHPPCSHTMLVSQTVYH